jgi:hypothetical protein
MSLLAPISVKGKHIVICLGKIQHKAHKLADIDGLAFIINKLYVTADNVAFLKNNVIKLKVKPVKLLVLKNNLKRLCLTVGGGKLLCGICAVNNTVAIVYEITYEAAVGHKKLYRRVTVVTSANARVLKEISFKEEAASLFLDSTAKIYGVFESNRLKAGIGNTSAVIKMLGISLCDTEGVGRILGIKSKYLILKSDHLKPPG